MFLSIIIPVYNVKEYLPHCVSSIIKECANIDYEAILVDDGSTDGSDILCDKLAKEAKQFQVLHKTNGGLSDARNYGVLHAQGEYVFYIDSDDYLADGGMKIMVEAALQSKSDVICGNFYYQYSDHKTLFNPESHEIITYNGGEEALSVLIDGKQYQNFAWGKLIRKELAQKYLFPKGKLFEDTYWFHLILHSANHVTVINKPIIHYLQRSGSISFEYKLKSLDILDGYAKRLIFFREAYPTLVNKQKKLMAENCIDQAWMICHYLNKSDRPIAIKKLRKVINNYKLQENSLLGSKQQRNLKLIMKNIILYKWLVIIEKIRKKIINK
ncbi:glycosyltransferase family 2 protein [Phocaeicola coprocola]|uniref:glycosyltransferase family 2 protein n=1 Tax=Phocaeicola coprocola TaxID=310298 RepID=UPI00195999C5|nr:glycosyltransferase family 2 protein [Phocaeicola coprocola]MBM6713032.1 glycosyltransferase family 2 protein [Phocaeicola coprocola]